MSNIKISEMAEAESLNNNDLLTIVQSGINKKITKQNAIGDIIQALNNPTYTTTEGTDLSINNTRVGKMKFEYYGDTEQETTTGKNKMPYTLANIKSANTSGTWSNNVYTWNGVTFTINEDLSITVGGTFSQRAYLYLQSSVIAIPKANYLVNGCPTGGSSTTYRIAFRSL